jgi:iron complex outermembrane receptor protein
MKKLTFLFFPILVFAQQNDSTVTVEIKDVIINAIKASDRDPHTQTILDKKKLNERASGKDLPMLLELQPNVVTTSDAGTGIGYTGMRVRGSDISRINVTVNGVPVNDPESQQVYFVNTPDLSSSVNSIQLQRGVGSSSNGSGAFGASLNMQTNDFSRKAYGNFSTYYGSFNSWKHTVQGGSGLIKNRFFIEGRLSRISSDGYIDRASADLWSYYLHAGLVFKKTKIQFVHFSGFEKTYQAWYGVAQDSLKTNRTYNVAGTDFGAKSPPWGNQIDNYRQHYFQLFANHTFDRNWSLNFAAFTTLGKGYFEEFKADQRLSKYQLQSETVNRTDLVRRRWLDNVYYGALYGVGYENKNLDVKFGGMAAEYRGDHFGRVIWCNDCDNLNTTNNYYFSIGHKRDINFYAKANYLIKNKLAIYADLQYRFVQHIIKGSNNDLVDFDVNNQWHFFNPKAGLKYFINSENKIYASVAIANREPTRDDQIDNIFGAIKPETLYDAELGYQFGKRKIKFELNYFFMYYVNQLLLTGRLNDVGNPIKVNTPRSFRTGPELAVNSILWESKNDKRVLIGVEGNLSYSLNRILNFEERVPTYDGDYNLIDSLYLSNQFSSTTISFSPSWVAGGALYSEPIKDLSVKFYVKYVSRQYLDNTASKERSLNPYCFGDIQIAYGFKFNNQKSIRFILNLYNIWNQSFESNGYTFRERYLNEDGVVSDAFSYKYFYPQARFHMNGGIELNF